MKQTCAMPCLPIALKSLIAGSALSAVMMTSSPASGQPFAINLSSPVTLASDALADHGSTHGREQAYGMMGTYVPPKDSEQPSGSASTTGIRNCGIGDSDLTLLALAPREHIGKTALSHPTFVWYFPESGELEATFKLYKVEAGNSHKTFVKVLETSLISHPGIMTFTLPSEAAGLIPGGHYLWQVSVQCDADDISASVIAEADLTVASQLEGTALNPRVADPIAAIDRYAGLGLWYDALGLASLVPADNFRQGAQAALLEALSAIEFVPERGGEALFDESDFTFSNQLRLVANQQKLVADLDN